MAVYYWAAFWVEPFGLSGPTNAAVMGASVIGFWFLVVMAFFVLPVHAKLQNTRLNDFREFVLKELADIPLFRPDSAVGRPPTFPAMFAVALVVVPWFLVTMKLVAYANSLCTVVAAAALLTLLRGARVREEAAVAAKQYQPGAVVLAEVHFDLATGSQIRPAIVAGNFGPWLALIPLTLQDMSGRPDFVRFDQSDWSGSNTPQSFAYVLKMQLATPERIVKEAGWVTDSGWRKLTECAARVPVQLRHKMRSALEDWVPRFDDEEGVIDLPVAFGDEEAMRAVESLYRKHEAAQRHRCLHAFAAAFSLTILWVALHKVGLVSAGLKLLDGKGANETARVVADLSWKSGILWSMLMGVVSWAVVRGGYLASHVASLWHRLPATPQRIVTALFVGCLMSLTTAPSITAVAMFLIFAGATYAAIVLRLFRKFSPPNNLLDAAASLGLSLNQGGYLSEDAAHIFGRMNQDRFGANRAGRDATWNRDGDRQFD